MPRFEILDKQEKALWLPSLFDVLYENMKMIAPSEETYEQQRAGWLAEVSGALEKAPRQIILCFSNGELAGFVQYYTRENLLMVEEVQLKAAYQRTMMFGCLCRFMVSVLPPQIAFVEAYAESSNLHSRRMMERLGMEYIHDETPPRFLHLRGDAKRIKELLRI